MQESKLAHRVCLLMSNDISIIDTAYSSESFGVKNGFGSHPGTQDVKSYRQKKKWAEMDRCG